MSEIQKRGATILNWWKEYVADRDSGRPRALAARLRRANGIDALVEPEVHLLARRLKLTADHAYGLTQLVQVLAEVRASDAARLAQRLGGPEPKMSQLRFQGLLRAERAEFATALRRAVVMADRRCNVGALGDDLLAWDHPVLGEHVRVRWTFDYFGAPPPPRADLMQHSVSETDQ